jgi:Phage capsid family
MNPENPASFLSQTAKFLMAANGEVGAAFAAAQTQRVNRRVLQLLQKTGVPGGTTGDANFGSVLTDIKIASDALFASLRTQSCFSRMLDSGIRKTPLRTRIGAVTASVSAGNVGEGRAVALSRLTLASPELVPTKVAALIAFSTEVARSADPAALELIDTELRNAIATAVDEEFFALVTDTSTPSSSSSGTSADDVRADLKTLLGAVNNSGAGQLFWCSSVSVANALAAMEWPLGSVSPTGGELCQLPFLVSSAIPAGTLRLCNASAIAGNADVIDLALARQADIAMVDTTTMDTGGPVPAQMVSLWQSNMVAIRATISFAAEKIRSDAIAELVGINWGA